MAEISNTAGNAVNTPAAEFIEQLRDDSWAYLKSVVDVAREPFLILDQDLKVIVANDAFYQKFKVQPLETEKQSVFMLGNGQWDIPELRKLLEEIIPTSTFFKDFEVTHDFLNIGKKIIILNARRIHVEREPTLQLLPPIILLSIEDVTERRAAENNLVLSESRYRHLFETAQDGILLIDPATETIIDANPFAVTLFGYPIEEIWGKKPWEIGAIANVAYAKQVFHELQTKGEIRVDNLPVTSKAGQVYQVEIVCGKYPMGDAGMIQCNIRDISARRQAEERIATYVDYLVKLNNLLTNREVKLSDFKKELAAMLPSIPE